MAACVVKHPYMTRSLVLLISVVYPYFCGLGGFPAMDEGTYAWIVQLYHHNLANGEALAPTHGMSLWPLILAWVPNLPGFSLIWLRLADMITALITGWLLCSIMEREGGALTNLVALVFLLCMNDYEIINNGFKNSIYPAWACFLGAVCAVWNTRLFRRNFTWFCAGALVALGVLLRETFFPFAFLGLFVAWRLGGMRGACFFSLGGISLGILVFGAIELAAPGSLEAFYRGYVARRLIYQSQSEKIIPYFLKYGRRSILLFAPALCVSLAIIAWAIIFGKKSPFRLENKKRLFYFWLAVALLPLYESLTKISFYYHFALALPGLACLTALFAGFPHIQLAAAWKKNPLLSGLLLLLAFAGFGSAFAYLPGKDAVARTLAVLRQAPERRWPSSMVEQSTTLQVAELLNQALPDGGSVSSNCITNFIYPASGFMSPLKGHFDPYDFNHLADLGRFYLQTGYDDERILKSILANPPEVIVLANALDEHEPCYYQELRKIIRGSGQYEKFATVDPRSPDNHATDYRWLYYELYRHRSEK